MNLINMSGGTYAKVHEQEALYEKTLKPIESGGKAPGLLYFVFEGIPRDLLTVPGTRWVLLFADVFGKQYESEPFIMTPGAKPGYIPGTENPFLPPDDPDPPPTPPSSQ